MNADPYQAAVDVASQSQAARAGRFLLSRIGDAVARSIALDLWRRVRVRLQRLDASARVRGAGIALLTATVTQAVLVAWTPEMARPAAPGLLRLEVAAVALILIALAKPLAAAWSGSRLHRLTQALSHDTDRRA